MAEFPSELQAEVEKLERKHAENPEGRYFVPLANAYRKLGELESAEALLREGLRRHPDYLSAHIVLGRCLADRGATREASEEFRYVLSADPQNLIALRTLGELAAGEGRTAEAERWFEELLAVDPMNEEARRAIDELRGGAPLEAPEEFQPSAVWWEPPAEESAPAGPPLAQSPPLSGVGTDAPVGTPLQEDAAPEEDEPLPTLDDDLEAPQVVTETIAELYARQGFYDRAADTYRELIRRRGGDAALERRLAEVERLAAGGKPVAEPEPAEPFEPATREPGGQEPPPAESAVAGPSTFDAEPLADLVRFEESEPSASEPVDPLPFLEQLDAAFAAEPEPAAGEPTDTDLLASDPFADSFEDGFEPRASDAEPPPAAPALEESNAPAVDAPAGASIAAYLTGLLAWRPGASPSQAAGEGSAEVAPAPEWTVPTEPSGTGPAGDEAFPWEATAAAAPGADVQPLGGEDLYDYEALFSEATPSPAEPVAEARSEPEAAPAPEPAPEPEPSTASDDEDLESFQAWLRSLKQ